MIRRDGGYVPRFSRLDLDRAEQPVGLVIQAGGEEELVAVQPVGAVGGDGPQAVLVNRLAVGAVDGGDELAAVDVVGVDGPVAEVPDEDVAGQGAKAGGGDGHAPGGAEPRPVLEPADQLAPGVEL